MSSIEIACPHCHEVSVVPRTMIGRRGRCPRCREELEVPDPEQEPAPAARDLGDDETVATQRRATRPCPACGESILLAARKCRFCGELLDGSAPRRHTATGGERPPSHLTKAIITTLCCCQPFGIVAIVYAAQVDSRWHQGNHLGAGEASDKANLWANLGIAFGLATQLLYLVLVAAGG